MEWVAEDVRILKILLVFQRGSVQLSCGVGEGEGLKQLPCKPYPRRVYLNDSSSIKFAFY